MVPIEKLTLEKSKNVRYLLADIDDTMTKDGKLLPEAYSAMWKLRDVGIGVIPVTGRPAGWCDLIARQWPVEGVVGENGALVFYEEGGSLKQMFHPDVASADVQKKLNFLREKVLAEVQNSRVAKDQFSRLFDLAIDFAEEEPILPLETAKVIKKICEQYGAKAKISSIHVNAWYGEYDKMSMSLRFLEKRWGIDREQARKIVFYCGDSPNDVPMFHFFPLSCGVGNITQFEGYLEHEPVYVTSRWYGTGFAELADRLTDLRKM